MHIGIVNYGMGNLGSVQSALRFLGVESVIADTPSDLKEADGLVLPGVGSFGRAMDNLRKSGFASALHAEVVENGKPLFAICLGMHLLAQGSTESSGVEGLGWVSSCVVPVANEWHGAQPVRRPQVGWNTVSRLDANHPMLCRISDGEMVYFDHSFALPANCPGAIAQTNYFGEFTSMLAQKNIFGAQFHPEKSQRTGLVMLRNFTNIVASSKSESVK